MDLLHRGPALIGGELVEIQPLGPGLLERYSMGPLTCLSLWEGAKEDMKLDRGPWETPSDFTLALELNELAWIESHAFLRMNYHRSMKDQGLPEDGLALLAKYLHVAPYLAPQKTTDGASNVLVHPHLQLGNIVVEPKDIQDHLSRAVAISTRRIFAVLNRYPALLSAFRTRYRRTTLNITIPSLNSRRRRLMKRSRTRPWPHGMKQLLLRAPRKWAVYKQKIATDPIICKPLITFCQGVWDSHVLYFLRQSLMLIVTSWDKLSPEVPCPIEFSGEEKELHDKEIESTEIVWDALTSFRWGDLAAYWRHDCPGRL